MALTVSQAFTEFQSKCEPRPISEDDVATKHTYLRQTLKNKVSITDDFLIGSYVKNTQIIPRSDIDIFIVLDNSYLVDQKLDTPRKVFRFLLKNLRQTYRLSILRSDGQAITIMQSRNFKIDVIPAYSINSNTYIIPNQHGQTWIQCNPRVHIEYLTNWNQSLGGKLKPLIKMVKCWSKIHQVPIKSFHLELLVVDAFKSISPEARAGLCSSYPRALTHIFQQGCLLIDEPFYDEVGERVDQYLEKGLLRQRVWVKLKEAAERSIIAWHFQKLGRNIRANKSWRILFGHYFSV
jgi:predicted nucleotidyltransferase